MKVQMSIFLLFCWNIFLFTIVAGQMNIISKVPIYASDNPYGSNALVDNDKENCFQIMNRKVKWIVFDLQNVYSIQKIILWNGKSIDNQNISVYMGNEFIYCMFHKLIPNYQVCNSGIKQNNKSTEVTCTEGPNSSGQYLALVKGSFTSSDNLEGLTICEVEVFGTFLQNGTKKTRPTISSETLPIISSNMFNITNDIRKNVPTVTIPSGSTSLYYANDNCEPIIWDKETKFVFSVACKTIDEKGRIAVFGKDEFFSNNLQADSLTNLRSNLYKWLSPQSTDPSVISSKSLSTIIDLKEKVKRGDIIDVIVWSPVPNEVLQEIKALLLNGSVSVVVHHTFWVSTTKEARNSYLEILNIFNVDFSPKIINWGIDKTLNFISTDINEDLLSIDMQLERMARSHDYFLKSGKEISLNLLEYPFKILEKTKAREYLNQIVSKYNELLKWICPCKIDAKTDKTERMIIDIFGNLIRSQLLADSNYKPPCVKHFPGDFESTPNKVNVTISVDGQYMETLNPIGYYLEPGATLEYKVSDIRGQWDMSIGCHSDHLDDKRQEWFRYPNIYINRVRLNDFGKVYSPFGGVIWLFNVQGNQTITIYLSNVVPMPFFNIRDKTSLYQWDSQKLNPGLWAVVGGDNIMFCLESNLIRTMESKALYNLFNNHWDIVVRMDYSLKSENWKEKKPEIVVLDILPAFGYGHSGYPIVVFEEWFNELFNWTFISNNGSWGLYHEIGHNLQEASWTFQGTVEVTNNIFCLYNLDKLLKLPFYGSKTVKYFRDYDRTEETKQFLESGANFVKWKSEPFIGLLIYAQMVNNFGWGFFKKVFEYYKITKMDLKSENEKIMMWINVTSTITKQNLIPMFDFWGFPIDDRLKSSLSQFPCFFPADFFRDLSDTRTNYIKTKYSSCSGTSKFFEDFLFDNYNGEIRPNYIKSSQ